MTSTGRRQPSVGPSLVLVAIGLGLDALVSWTMAQQSYRWLPVQASTAAPLVDGLFSFETGVGTFVFGAVVSVMVWVVLTDDDDDDH